ncbi:universal stress protein [Halanaerobium hydrogeniformans]|uniref:Universal stress protein n=1 Tax=Halanaerobium hydrogeniformans TaxID=656519 RepID=E4RL86_HALHG|nr:universal stress protein [Halanaerobium hydrogeniformans]ADQ15767.1 UspA domain-containing protein [Halanaerobium hydrogeniformans]
MNKILVAVDGSDSSKRAAEKAAELALSLDSEVTLIHVHTETAKPPTDQFNEVASYLSAETLAEIMDQKEERIRNEKEKIVEEAAVFFDKKGIEINKEVLYGDPADVVCDYAEENGFDLIVLADKGQGKVKRFLLGSISDKVVRHANISVLIVK